MAEAAAPSAAATAARLKVPVEVVLPTIYYAILLIEAGALLGLTLLDKLPPFASYALGWAGTASMLLMHVYSLRKRVRAMFGWGRLSTWLHVHIFLGLQGAMWVCFHSAHLQTLQNISGITIIAVLVVVASGMMGRYLFSLLPKGLSGERLSARQIEQEIAELEPRFRASAQPAIEAAIAEYAAKRAITGKLGFIDLVREDFRSRRALSHLMAATKQVVRSQKHGGSSELEDFAALVKRRADLARRLAFLQGAEQMFRRWHLFHKPLTFLLLGAVVLHVVAHYIYAAQFSA